MSSTQTPAYIIGRNNISVVLNGKLNTIPQSHPNFTKIGDAIKAGEFDKLQTLVDIPKTINTFGQGKITVTDGKVFYNDVETAGVVVDRILEMLSQGFDVTPMVRFLENVYQNPSKTAMDELWLFAEAANFPITPDGHLLAWKAVRQDFRDIHSGKFDNSPGQVLEMERREVDDNRNRTCSYGFHFAALEYAEKFHKDTSRLVIVKINPKDVVAIPSDYSNQKGRTCRYEVVGEVERSNATFSSVVVDKYEDKGWDESEDDDFDDDEEVQKTFRVCALSWNGDYLVTTVSLVGDSLFTEEDWVEEAILEAEFDGYDVEDVDWDSAKVIGE